MAITDSYTTPVFQDKGGWRYKVKLIVSDAAGSAITANLDMGAVVVEDSLEFTTKFGDDPIGLPEIPTAQISLYYNDLPAYVRERVRTPEVYRSASVEGQLLTNIYLSNVWVITSDFGVSTLLESEFTTLFIGTQTPAPEDVYTPDEAGNLVLTMELEDIRATALKNVSTEFIRWHLWGLGADDATIYTQTPYLFQSIWAAGAQYAHFCQATDSTITLFKLTALFDAIEAAFQQNMGFLMRATNTTPLNFTFDGVQFYRPGCDIDDTGDLALDIDDLYFVGAIQDSELSGFVAPSDAEGVEQWVAGTLSYETDSFHGDGYKNAWDLLHRLGVNFFTKGSLTSFRIDFTQLQKGFHAPTAIIGTPDYASLPEIRRGAGIATRTEVSIRGVSGDDAQAAEYAATRATKNESQIDCQALLHTIPPKLGCYITDTADPAYTLFNGGGGISDYTTSTLLIKSDTIPTRGLYYAAFDDPLLAGKPLGVTSDNPIMMKVHPNTTFDNGNATFTATADAHQFPELTGGDFTSVRTSTNNYVELTENFLTAFAAIYTLLQQQSGLPLALAKALYGTYSKYNQAIIKSDVPREQAAFYYTGEQATLDLTQFHADLSFIESDAILLNCTTNSETSQCEFLTRGT